MNINMKTKTINMHQCIERKKSFPETSLSPLAKKREADHHGIFTNHFFPPLPRSCSRLSDSKDYSTTKLHM